MVPSSKEAGVGVLSSRGGDAEDGDLEAEPEAFVLDADAGNASKLPLVDSSAASSRSSSEADGCWSHKRVLISSLVLLSGCLLTLGLLPETLIEPVPSAKNSKAVRAVDTIDQEGTLTMSDSACAAPMDNADIPGYDVDTFENIYDMEGCCSICDLYPQCTAWVWLTEDEGSAFRCYIKAVPEAVVYVESAPLRIAGRRSVGPAPGGAPPAAQQAPAAGPAPEGGTPEGGYDGVPVQPKSPLQVLGERITGLFHTPWGTGTPAPQYEPSWEQAVPMISTTEAMQPCGLIEEGVEYLGNDLEEATSAMGAAECCDRCGKNAECFAWTLAHGKCYLKGDAPKAVLTQIDNEGVTSGKPTQVGREIETTKQTPGQSLFCWALMIPDSYEVGLVKLQYENAWSLFGCDEYAIFSDQVVEVVAGLSTVEVNTKLDCESGGEFGTALNTEIFLAVWARLLGMNRWNFHDWIVKVDLDCTFSPSRLRDMVAWRPVDGPAVYLNNCQRGMHGPLEVFSRSAVEAWESGREQCEPYFEQQCGGDCGWGEDMFVDQCLWKVLQVQRDFEAKLLREDHCDPPPGWDSCTEPEVVAFHPFKSEDEYAACMLSMGE